MQTLIIDHYDSFTYNLFQLVAEIQGKDPWVIPHDSDTLINLDPDSYDNIILSPGPGHPDNVQDFKTGKAMILHNDKPILGVCLGHQGIFSTFGGRVEHAPSPVHGCISRIIHHQDALYQDIPNSLQVMRYHSLICTGPIPEELIITAWTLDGLIMGLRHRHKPIWGIQYHPESIASEYGQQLLLNFKHLTLQHYQQLGKPLPSKALFTSHCNDQIHPVRTKSVTVLEVISEKLPFQGDIAGVFQTLFASHPSAVWLDSSQIIKGFSRFSYMGALQGPLSYQLIYDAKTRITNKIQGADQITYPMSIFAYLKQDLDSMQLKTRIDLPFDFQGGFIGYFGYELNQETASMSEVKSAPHPDAQWLFLDRFIAFDHQEQCCYVVAVTRETDLDSNKEWVHTICQAVNTSCTLTPTKLSPQAVLGTWVQPQEAYMARIKDSLNFIQAGVSYEVCLTNKLEFDYSIDPLRFYVNLRHCHPAPHAAFFQFSDVTIACSSMERFLKIDRHRQIQAKPIKGTMPRGQSQTEDQKSALELKESEKFRSEHLMIVDLLRNDLGKISQIGSVAVTDLMTVETYATVHQLVSVIVGQLKPDIHVIDCIQHAFPGGSMTGAPKIRTISILNQLETQARGIYSGSLGYISLNGTVDLNIVIRTAEITADKISIGAGGAIIALSDPEEEFREMVLKTRALQTALSRTLQEQ